MRLFSLAMQSVKMQENIQTWRLEVHISNNSLNLDTGWQPIKCPQLLFKVGLFHLRKHFSFSKRVWLLSLYGRGRLVLLSRANCWLSTAYCNKCTCFLDRREMILIELSICTTWTWWSGAGDPCKLLWSWPSAWPEPLYSLGCMY